MTRLRGMLTAAAMAAALVGGLLLLVAIGVTCASVVRGLFGRPILGDSEIVEICLGIAIALYLPWAEMRGSHVIVDVFTQKLPARGLAWLDAVMRAGVALVATVLAVQMADGTLVQWDRERASMFLEIPYWWGFAGAAVGLALWTVTAVFVAIERFGQVRAA